MKRFMIVVLAVAVLFGFAACDNSTPSGDGTSTTDPSVVASVKAVFNGEVDYLVGETPDADDFTFTGYDIEGNIVSQLDSALFTTEDEIEEKADNEVEFIWKNGATTLTAKVKNIPGYAVDSIKIAVKDGAQTTYYNATSNDSAAKYQKVNKNDFTVTAVYDGGKEKDVSDADTLKLELGTVSDGTFTALTNWYTAPTDSNKQYAVKATFSEKDATTDAVFSYLINKVTAMRLVVADDFVLYYAEDADPSTASLASYDATTKDIKVVADYQNGETNVDVTDKTEFASEADGTFGGITNVSSFPEATSTSATLYAKYNEANVVSASVATTNAPLKLAENVKVGIKATIAESGVEVVIGKDYGTALTTEAPEGLTINYKLADGSTGDVINFNETAAGKVGYKITPAVFHGEERSLVDLTITVEGYDSIVVKDAVLATAGA